MGSVTCHASTQEVQSGTGRHSGKFVTRTPQGMECEATLREASATHVRIAKLLLHPTPSIGCAWKGLKCVATEPGNTARGPSAHVRASHARHVLLFERRQATSSHQAREPTSDVCTQVNLMQFFTQPMRCCRTCGLTHIRVARARSRLENRFRVPRRGLILGAGL